MTRHTLLSLLALAAGTTAAAQSLYRCGSTYSQTPCGDGATPTRIHQDVKASPGAGSRGADLCREQGAKSLPLKDPYSAVVDVSPQMRYQAIDYAGTRIVAKAYLMTVNAKNSYGAYAGASTYICYLSEDEARVLQVR